MATDSVKDFLDRENVKKISKTIIDIVSPLLVEAINYGTNVLDKCLTSNKAGEEKTLPLFSLYSHLIQMADGIEVLIASGCGPPGHLLLRSLYEARLSIKYILEKDTDKRSIAWLVKYYDDEITYLELMDIANPKGKEFLEKHQDDNILKIAPPPSLPQIPKQIFKLRQRLEQPDFAIVYEEYYRHKTKKRKAYVEWYSLFEGPPSLKKLAEYFHEGSIYETLYRSWSKSAHANEAANTFLIRNPEPIVVLALITINYLVEATKIMLNEFLPYRSTSAHFEKWLAQEVIPKQLTLTKLNIAQLDFLAKEQN